MLFPMVSRSCRARFPADQGCLDATSSVAASRDASVLLFEALAQLGGAFGAGRLRRRPPSAAASLRSAWLSSARCFVRGEHIRGEVYPCCGNPVELIGPSRTYIVAANIGRHYVSSRRAAPACPALPAMLLVAPHFLCF